MSELFAARASRVTFAHMHEAPNIATVFRNTRNKTISALDPRIAATTVAGRKERSQRTRISKELSN